MGRFRDVELADLELRGERLRLRRWRPTDAERVAEVMQDTSMTQFLALPTPYTLEDARQFVTGFGHEGRDDGTGIGSAVVEQASGRIVGASALRLAGDDPHIGYWVAPDARGHKYAAEVSRVLARWAFDAGLPRVTLAADVRNLPSAATALAAGFRFEGVSRSAVVSPGGGGVAPQRGELARFARLAGDPDAPIAPTFPRLPAGGLSDGVLTLRTMRPGDGDAFYETDDVESVRWNFTGQRTARAEAALIAARAGLDWLVGSTARCAMVDVESGRFAGTVGLRMAGPPQIGGIGYGVHPDFRGRSYTTRALRLIAPWAFESADMSRLELGAKTGNVASQRAAARAGFEPDGIRRLRMRNADGSFGDEVRFALLNPRYESPSRSRP